MFHVDCYGSYGGYLFDFARSRVVGDDPAPAQRGLLEAVIGAVETTCHAIKPGMTSGEVCAVTDRWIAESEFVSSIPDVARYGFVGHGLGMMWEAPWLMTDNPAPIEPNMYLAVEVMLGHPTLGGAMFEHNGIVTDHGFEVLTSARSRWW